MRLTALTLTNYGNFRSERITFSAEPGTLNLLMAPNGGGKSVLRAAFADLLFGIGGQSPMGFRYGYPGMRILADAVDEAGQPFCFGRRKGQGNTLIDADGAALDPTAVARWLGAVDRKALDRLFALDTDRLRAGREDLLDSHGDFGAALVSGAGGARDLRALRRRLEEARDALAPARRAANRPFYTALDRFVEARKRKEAALLRPDRWKKMQTALAEARRAQAAQNAIVQDASAGIARLERIRRVRPILAALDAAASWLDAHPHAPVLDAALQPRLAKAREQLVIITQRLVREREQAAQLAAQRDAVTVEEAPLAEAEAIDALTEMAGAARKARADLPQVAGEADSRRTAMAERLRDLGSKLPPERAGEVVPPRAVANRVRRLIKDREARRQAMEAATAAVSRQTAALAEYRQAAERLQAPADVSALEAMVREIRADGDPMRQQAELGQRHRQAAAELETALAHVPGWSGSATDLAALPVLAADTYHRHAEALKAAAALAQRRREEAGTARTDRDAARTALERLSAGGAVPDAAALEAARRHRDQGWDLVFRKAFSTSPPDAAEEQTYTGGQSLPLVYQRAVGNADHIADQRMRDAETAARIDAAESALAVAGTRQAAADAMLREAMAAQAEAIAAWTDICRSLGGASLSGASLGGMSLGGMSLGEAPSLNEVLGFLAARDKAIAQLAALAVAEAQRAELARRHDGWAKRLAAWLGAGPDTDLAALLVQADTRLAAARKDAQAQATLAGALSTAETALKQAQSELGRAQAGMAAWQQDWAAALRELGRPPDEDPVVTEDVLASLDELAAALRQHTELAERVGGMRQDIARFGDDAAALAARVAPDLDRADPFALVSQLGRRLQAARQAADQRALLAEQARHAEDKAAVETARQAAMQDELQAILASIGAATPEAADQRLALAAERARQAAALAQARDRLADDGDSLPADMLRAEVMAVPADEAPRLLREAEETRQAAQDAAQRAAGVVAELTQQMQAAQDETEAVDAAADQQAAVATMGRVLEDALLHHLAAGILDRALAAVEQADEPRMLQRITALFADLTGGAYERVLTEPDDAGNARLTLVQRAELPDRQQAVDDLSEGTRDQLYLALRLAAIEKHVETAPPLPFIGDDILQTFDDDRAVAALRTLLHVSRRVQVILLTHHRHVLDLARLLPAGAVHICRTGATLETA